MAGFESGPLLFEPLQSLMEAGLDESCRILGDIFLHNCSILDIPELSIQKCNLLKTYADSLFADKQFKRALMYYQKVLDMSSLQEDNGIKWSMYQCYMGLNQYRDALEILTSIPVKSRSVKVTLALAKLYHYFKKDSPTAMVYYRMVLMESPFAVEAFLALLSLGTSYSQLEMMLKQHPQSLLSMKWLVVWLKTQVNIADYHYSDAVKKFQALTQMGVKLSPEMTSQMGWCMSKLSRRDTALELFRLAMKLDPYQLNYMDTYARLLTNMGGFLMPNSAQLADTLVTTSVLHAEPWIARLWSVVRKSNLNEDSLATPSISVLVKKVAKIVTPVKPSNSEIDFVLGTISMAKQLYDDAAVHFNSAIRKDVAFFDAYESVLRCYLFSRNYKAALSTMKTALMYIMAPALKLYLEAIVLANKPEFRPRAKICLEESIKQDPTFEKSAISLSIIYRQERNPMAGIGVLKQVFQVHESSGLHVESGRCYMVLRKYVQARDHFEKATKLNPENKDALLGVQEVEGILQGGFGGGEEGEWSGEGEEGDSGRDEDENQMDESEEVLVLGSRETLEGLREFGDNIDPLVDFNEDF